MHSGISLGSVRQIVRGDSYGQVTLTRSYDPFGSLLTSVGNVTSAFGYAGQWKDGYIKLIDLRSRWYNTETGRFINKDTWQGDYNRPLSLNKWIYVEDNPTNRTDPSGRCYGPLSFLRNIPIESQICGHLDQAMFLYAWPGSNSTQRILASAYIGGWAFSHSGIIVGAAGVVVAGGQAAITWLTGLYAASQYAQQAAQTCPQLENYLPSLQPPNNLNYIWNQVIVSSPKIDYLMTSPDKDGFIKLGYSFDTLQSQLNIIGESVTPDHFSWLSEYGPRFEKAVEVLGPSGLMGRITTVWQVDFGTNVLRIITAIPEVFK